MQFRNKRQTWRYHENSNLARTLVYPKYSDIYPSCRLDKRLDSLMYTSMSNAKKEESSKKENHRLKRKL